MMLAYEERSELRFVPFGRALYNKRLDFAALSRHPRTERERQWVDHVRCRLNPGVLLRVGERSTA